MKKQCYKCKACSRQQRLVTAICALLFACIGTFALIVNIREILT